MMTLNEREPDSYIARGPRYPWGGLFGGQIVAQSLGAAAATVDPAYGIHSLHAYFIRRGDADEPIRFDVDRLRNGRNFVTRAVVARQSRGAIFHMSASFHAEPTERYVLGSPFPDVPPPDGMANDSWISIFDRRYISEADGRATAWLRVPQAPADDPVLAAAALAYLSDDLATDAVVSQRQTADGVTGKHWESTSLDHAIWFHRPIASGDGAVCGNDWQLHDFHCEGVGTPRGLAIGQVYTPDGTHLATVAQEVLLRPVQAA
ncbi:MAG: thioesterase family protein [Acidimicrobiales bacterium]|nr:thioesterase family protein [Acidimicrobiales bacterium]